MAKPFQTLIGKRVKRWVVVEDKPQTEERNRMERIRCVACGKEKEISAGSIRKGVTKDCKCGKLPPKVLSTGSGIACKARNDKCERSRTGRCCYWCADPCDDKCLNSPDKCGSFYSDKSDLERFLEDER